MTCQYVKSVSCPLVIAFLGLQGPAIQAEIYDITDLQQPDTSSPAMTGFYNVTPDGETTIEDPLASGFATSASSDFDTERSQEEKPESNTSEQQTGQSPHSNKENRQKRTIRIRVRRKPPQQNLADQFQCERHGLYYTNDGRCIVPAYSHPPQIPLPLSAPGMRPHVPSYGNTIRMD